jgi:hypothetical protein
MFFSSSAPARFHLFGTFFSSFSALSLERAFSRLALTQSLSQVSIHPCFVFTSSSAPARLAVDITFSPFFPVFIRCFLWKDRLLRRPFEYSEWFLHLPVL